MSPAEELDLGTTTVTLTEAAADLDASVEAARPLDPFEQEATWAEQTARRWRGMAAGLSDARARFDHQHTPTTPFGIDKERQALGGMKDAIVAVEATGMDLEALRVGLDAGGAVLQVADETMQVSLGVLERRGYVDEGATGGAVLDPMVHVGSVSEAGAGFEELPLLAEQLMAQQRLVNATWAMVRATAIERAAGSDRHRKREIESAIAYVDDTLGAIVKVATFDARSLFRNDVGTLSQRTGSLLKLLAADELARLNANIDAAMGHGAGLRNAAEKEELRGHLELLCAYVRDFDNRVAATRPGSESSLNDADPVGTSVADALAAQTAATDVLERVTSRASQAEASMTGALAIPLHEPARSVLHGPDGGEQDLEALRALHRGLDRRRSEHAVQVNLLRDC